MACSQRTGVATVHQILRSHVLLLWVMEVVQPAYGLMLPWFGSLPWTRVCVVMVSSYR